MLFFDLPVVNEKDRKNYAHFVKDIKKLGFYMLQESVYIKLDLDERSALSSENDVKKLVPPVGNIAILRVTEKQFASIDFILGESTSDVVSSEGRIIKL